MTKRIAFAGTALDDLRAFPDEARRRAGYQIQRLQDGHPPDHSHPMLHAGSGISEIGIHLDSGGHRVLYVAELAGTITVLHCFQKKAAQTSAADATLARRRFHDLKPVSPRGYDNIWDAIESSREAAASMTLRSQLLTKLRDITEARALSQPLAAKFLGTTQTRIAEVQQGRIDLFSIDALITMLITAGCQVGITVTPGRA